LDVQCTNARTNLRTRTFSHTAQDQLRVQLLICTKAAGGGETSAGERALMIAAKAGREDLVELIVGFKADVNAGNAAGTERALWEARARRELAEERERERGRDEARGNVGVQRSLRKTYDAIVPASGDGMWDPDATIQPITGFWEGIWEAKYDEIAKQVATAIGIDDATFTFSGAAARKREAQRRWTGRETANALISNGGLVMTQDLPKTEVR
jgi:hypothetical protein